MGRIKIGDIPEDQKISKEEMRKVLGGIIVINSMPSPKSTRNLLFGTQFLGSQVGWDPGEKGF